ncbi:MAG: hypothetical protein UY26_C0003G0024 [Candidatus Jorgensenbacteria bacterium GW2011_GWA1_48_13]|uniref:DUF1648 domain-containing protein n=2 Tax=Candidatus Joergenseniibacteriota TaxID=1752739 RepID=A0A0G1W8K8_9BACT|nr:MAG: hypothetical protein UY26_C0003G0024 [Candidatus Jorgensenbacteria bacterium GW2011_GWA1_48_13]KKU99305.1 MAG: hypothetical protein UY32_C0002G0041 [Candidatus Jorgensenbacteria bacterium GW2011_GWC1_48_8]KKW14985.1 MAG: hypothetical protein UY55_C0002G0041 [Candidatus Jorgensenbacteria bacterium GW2011_GWB1_50_10]
MLGIIGKIYSERKVMFVLLAAAMALMAFSLVLVLLNVNELSAPLILHFDKLKGIDFLGEKSDVWGIWAGGFALLVLNSLLASVFFHRERVLAYVFAGVNLLFAVLVLVALGVIFSVN